MAMAAATAMETDDFGRVYKKGKKEWEAEGDCGLRRLKFSKIATATGDTSVVITGAGEGHRIVYLDEDREIWKCRHCSWTYNLLGHGMDLFQKHENHLQVVMPFRTLTQTGTTDKDQISSISTPPTTVILPEGNVQIHVGNQILVETIRENEWEVLKSIVYGGLIESITSLCVISSATGANISTLNAVSLGLANLIGGLFVMLHHLSEIKSSADADQNSEQADRYWKLLGRRENFGLHATVSVISYLLFGLLPPLVYGFWSREIAGKAYRLAAVSAPSLACIALLAIGKACLTPSRPYIKYFAYYLGLGFTASGLSYIAAVMICRFLGQLHLLNHNAPLPFLLPLELFGVASGLSS